MKYENNLRLIRVVMDNNKEIEVLTNNFSLPATEIAELYKRKWQVELFFKWIKQNLKIKKFLGLSENSVYLQLWIALIAYVLLWRLYHQVHFNFRDFLEFVRHVVARLFIPDGDIRFSKWKEKLKRKKTNQMLLFEEVK